MSFKDAKGLPPYPVPPPGVSRLAHLPTVEASIRYWEAVETRARQFNDHALARTAAGLKSTYESARFSLSKLPKNGAKPAPES
jgi:hypothetical protein